MAVNAMKAGLLGRQSLPFEDNPTEEAVMVLCVGADLSRKRIDWQAVWPDGEGCVHRRLRLSAPDNATKRQRGATRLAGA
jgi:hypothetical protein